MLKDVRESISLKLGWFHSCHPPLSGSTIFNRIESPASSDVLNGNSSNVFCLFKLPNCVSVLVYFFLRFIDYRPVLSGLYIGSRGRNSGEIIHLQRKFGQWKDDSGTTETSDLQFYEYVEALNITGDSCLPAGQVTSLDLTSCCPLCELVELNLKVPCDKLQMYNSFSSRVNVISLVFVYCVKT